jgi:hypothetical protein
MMKFKSVLFRLLQNAAHFNYCNQMQKALAEAPPDLLALLGTLPEEFDTWMEKENALMMRV